MRKPIHPQQGIFNIDNARAEAQAAEERRKRESVEDKQAIRLALISRCLDAIAEAAGEKQAIRLTLMSRHKSRGEKR